MSQSRAPKVRVPSYSSLAAMKSQAYPEKSNWLGLGGKGHSASGHWRSALCRLTKEPDVDRCLLNIYVDVSQEVLTRLISLTLPPLQESVLFQTVYIHLLRQSDIRPADNSLFFRKDCIVIYSTEQQRWMASNNAEPVYLQFSKSELCNLWISLLRSYAVPEIYGRWLNRPNAGGSELQGGSYRMWREVQLTVASGRNLGISKLYDPSQTPDEVGQDVELKDIDVYCEIVLNDAVCARTTTKKGLGLPEWHESFMFSDLPPFENMEIAILKEKKVSKPSLLGKVTVDLVTFRRGEVVEGWYPVQSTNFSSQLQLGEIRLKVRVTEELILPHSSYSTLQQVLNTRNLLQWLQDLENILHIKTLLQPFINLAISQESIIEQIQDAAVWEIERAISSHQTIFRGNNIFTKTMEKCLVWYGNAFLEASIGNVLRRLLAEKVAIEVDPVRSGKPSKEVVKNVDLLIFWCREFWDQIYGAKESCPKEFCALLSTVRNLVEENGRRAELLPQMQQQRPWQSVSAFIFLRFIVPGILHPHLFGLCSGLPDPAIHRSLKLVAKVIQSMANLNAKGDQKEISMAPLREFIKQNMSRMMDYLAVVSTTRTTLYSTQRPDDRENRHAMNNLMVHIGSLPTLERESVAKPPSLIDPSRELAIITSAIIRYSRDVNNKTRARKLDNAALESLCTACFEVEAEALQRVNELAIRLAQERRRASASAAWSQHSAMISKSPSLGSIPNSKSSLPPTAYMPSTLQSHESHPRLLSLPEPEPGPAGNTPGGKVDIGRIDIGEGGTTRWSESTSENPDEGAKRKKSFMRGIFSGL
ncbi:Ras GTPase-activating protein gap-2 [Leucoagaricus sp. SymC.cos]|nr:Ras GTPase-activating protein gap-2 [Leucoagaricus sp. SymC.cos]